MVIIAILALVLRFAFERIIKITVSQNDVNAQATLRLISTALENYAKDNKGVFPDDLSVLIRNNPQYLDKDYIVKSPIRGYDYNCSRLEALGYSCSATPVKCRLTGNTLYTVTTGGLVVSEGCGGKE